MVLIECGCAGSSESVWHCALADSPLQGLPEARSNPTTHSAPVVWEGRLLLLALGTVTRETSRSQFHSTHFFETFSGAWCRHKASSTSRIRSDRLVPCYVLIFLVMKCSLCLISSDLLRTSSSPCMHPGFFFNSPAFSSLSLTPSCLLSCVQPLRQHWDRTSGVDKVEPCRGPLCTQSLWGWLRPQPKRQTV